MCFSWPHGNRTKWKWLSWILSSSTSLSFSVGWYKSPIQCSSPLVFIGRIKQTDESRHHKGLAPRKTDTAQSDLDTTKQAEKCFYGTQSWNGSKISGTRCLVSSCSSIRSSLSVGEELAESVYELRISLCLLWKFYDITEYFQADRSSTYL